MFLSASFSDAYMCFFFLLVEKRQYVHPTEFDVQYRATDTENSNPNIMISGSARKPLLMLCTEQLIVYSTSALCFFQVPRGQKDQHHIPLFPLVSCRCEFAGCWM